MICTCFEYDEKFEIIKFNPLLKWTLKEVEDYLKNNVPQYIQKRICKHCCVPCTRAIAEGEDIEPEDGGGIESQRMWSASRVK
jgi:3'-phosphoadenosine 5'-phosphosulfate sulfotransferase (PAPS reductase)/FAD synthetase